MKTASFDFRQTQDAVLGTPRGPKMALRAPFSGWRAGPWNPASFFIRQGEAYHDPPRAYCADVRRKRNGILIRSFGGSLKSKTPPVGAGGADCF